MVAVDWAEFNRDGAKVRMLNAGPYSDDLQVAVDTLVEAVSARVDVRDFAGVVLYLPPGSTYWIRKPPLKLLSLQERARVRVAIIGGGPGSVIRIAEDYSFDPEGREVAMIEVRGTPGRRGQQDSPEWIPAHNWTIENLRIVGPSGSAKKSLAVSSQSVSTWQDFTSSPSKPVVGIRLHGALYTQIKDVEIVGCETAGVVIQMGGNSNVLDGVRTYDCGIGIDLRRLVPWSEFCKDTVLWNPDSGETRRLCHPCEFEPTKLTEWCVHGDCFPTLNRNLDCRGGLCIPEGIQGTCPPSGVGTEQGALYDGWLRQHILARDDDGHYVRRYTYYSHEGPPSSNSNVIRHCLLENSRGVGMRIFGGSGVNVEHCAFVNSRENGLTARNTLALRIAGCFFTGNGARAESTEALLGAQLIVGDERRHGADPADIDWSYWGTKWVRCFGTNVVGCHFDGRADQDGTMRSSVGVRDREAEGTSVLGCSFQGHVYRPVWLERSKRAIVIPSWVDEQQPYRADGGADTDCVRWPV